MKNIYLFLFFSFTLHGLLLCSFSFFGNTGQGQDHLGNNATTQFEVRKKQRAFKKNKLRSNIVKTIKPSDVGVPTASNKEANQEPQEGPSQEKKIESLASAKGLIGLSRPLTPVEKYKVYLYRKIYNSIDYPEAAQKLKQEGLVTVNLSIKNNGQFTASLKKKSAYKRLNEAAQKTFNSISQFKALPESLGTNEWNIIVPVNYELKGR